MKEREEEATGKKGTYPKHYYGHKFTSGESSPSTSLVKSKAKLSHMSDSPADQHASTLSMEDTRELHDSILAFPTNDQPVLDTTLKDMLVSLRSTIHTDILSLMQQFKSDIGEVSDRVHHIENKMGDFATTFNELVDGHNERKDDFEWIKSKLADLEDRDVITSKSEVCLNQ